MLLCQLDRRAERSARAGRRWAYRVPTRQRARRAQRIDGRGAVIDLSVVHDEHAYLVARHIQSHVELHGLVTEYAQRSETRGIPAILATLRTADELIDALA